MGRLSRNQRVKSPTPQPKTNETKVDNRKESPVKVRNLRSRTTTKKQIIPIELSDDDSEDEETPKVIQKKVVEKPVNKIIKKCTQKKAVEKPVKKIIKSAQKKVKKSPLKKTAPPSKEIDVNSLTISELLELNEGNSATQSTSNFNHKNQLSNVDEWSDDDDSTSESENDWEEVLEAPDARSENKPSIPEGELQITIDREVVGKKKKGFDVEGYIRRQQNASIRELQEYMHKCSLLILIARGRHINNELRSDELMAIASSMLPTKECYPPKHVDCVYMERFMTWFSGTYKFNGAIKQTKSETPSKAKQEDSSEKEKISLVDQIRDRTVQDEDSLVFIFVCILRALGLQIRLIYSLQPLSLKPHSADLLKGPKNEKEVKPNNVIKPKLKYKSTVRPNQSVPDNSSQQSTSSNTGRPMISSSSENEEEESKKKNNRKKKSNETKSNPRKERVLGQDFWPEVYLEEEEQWASLDVVNSGIYYDDAVKKATKPVCYILAFDNDGRIKDITCKYDSNWSCHSQKKKRVNVEWWNATLKPFKGKQTARDKAENSFLKNQVESQGIPTSIQGLKNHPNYVLKQHLLKFEALYPPDCPSLGFVTQKNLPVYARECVKVLHSRDLWLKQAKVVKMGEKAYKVVKARPKYDRGLAQIITDQPLDLFGEWQVEEYIPPPAKDGKVPRNDYGNVELFLLKMLPKGTVHMQYPGLQRVAKKLDIDCAPALTGFDYHSGWSHPVFDGFVVCEEFKDILLDAWRQEQQEQVKKDDEKRTSRAIKNWVKLLKGLLIKERLERRYAFSQYSGAVDNDQPSTSKGTKRAKKTQNDEAGPVTKRPKRK